MKHKWCMVLLWVFALSPLAALAILYGSLPDQVPLHWGLDGAVDRYGSKAELLLLGVIAPAMALLFMFLPKLDPRKNNYEKFQGYYDSFAIAVVAFLGLLMGLTFIESFRPGTLSVGRFVTALMGLLFLFLGNMLGKIKPNFFFGVRTPWTISDPDVWNKTHRLAGMLWFWSGLLFLVAALLLPEAAMFLLLMACILITTLVMIVMSYIWFRKKHP